MHDNHIPQRCSDCGKIDVVPDVIAYTARVKNDGSLHTFSIGSLHVLKCRSCGEVLFDDITDEQITQGLREHLHLLSPRDIREQLKSLGLMQRELAERIRVAPETISRWLSGAYIQSRAMDELMRLFFEREKSKTPARIQQQVTIQAGKLSQWGRAATRYAVQKREDGEVVAFVSPDPILSEIEADMPLETARAPPQYGGCFYALCDMQGDEFGRSKLQLVI